MLFAYGFRIFFLLAALDVIFALGVWLGALGGLLPAESFDVSWHSREMLFGYVSAVLAGFFLTAVPNWTGSERLQGQRLASLAALWLLGRVAPLTPASPQMVAFAQALFVFALALLIALPIAAKRSRRNYAFPALLAILGWAALAEAGLGSVGIRPALHVAIYAVLAVIVIFSGRIVPMFTRNALGVAIRDRGLPDDLANWSAVAVVVTAFVAAPKIFAVVLAIAAVANFWRMIGWSSRKTLRSPIVWILHLSYLWIGAAYALSGAAALGWVAPSAAIHALTAGAIGSMTYGMMSRVALGHTGRKIYAAPAVVFGYAAVNLGALIRVALPQLQPQLVRIAWSASGALWLLAFAAFLVVYTPILLAPRPDGRLG